jgi:hypothetical protein
MIRLATTLTVFAAVITTWCGAATAQNPPFNYLPPPSPPGYVQPTPTYIYPVTPGGLVTGNPSPYYYDPNAVVNNASTSSMYWDPYRGWVTNTQNTSFLNSATSSGRAPMAGTSIQYYTYWNGSQWVQGTRWLGQDGQWHGDHANTVVGPNGSTHTQMEVYAPNPMAGGGATSARQSLRPAYRRMNGR